MAHPVPVQAPSRIALLAIALSFFCFHPASGRVFNAEVTLAQTAPASRDAPSNVARARDWGCPDDRPWYEMTRAERDDCERAGELRLVPGSPFLEPGRITSSADTFVLIVGNAGQRPDTSLQVIERVDLVTEADRILIRVAQDHRSVGSATVDTSWLDAATLGSVRYRAHLGSVIHEFEFDGRSIAGTVRSDSGVQSVRTAAADPPFLAPVIGVVLRAVQLHDGFTARMWAYNPPAAQPMEMEIRIHHHQELGSAAGDSVMAWVATLTAGGRASTLWLHHETGATLGIRTLAGGRTFTKARSGILLPAVDPP